MFRLIYTSRPCIEGTPDHRNQALRSILESARRNNRVSGVTGVLFYSRDSFLQILEGERCAVETTFEFIVTDRRHQDATVMLEADTRERLFGAWSMGFIDEACTGADGAPFGNFDGFDPTDLPAQCFAPYLRSMIAGAESTRPGSTSADYPIRQTRALS
jgi:hypothetical protein